ncbi:MAG: tetratricopeptide domain protein [Flaviaesturariibacter sp.]|nr:tetratricopeptide domain protein [Flaviaesturariibacter sp.]
MAATKTVETRTKEDHEVVVERAKDFWTRNSRAITIAGLAIILLGGGYLAYKKFIKEPNEVKASEAIFKAEDYFRQDSLQMALNGDGVNPGFLKIIDKYGGTKAGNLAKFYAGACYLELGNATNAAKYLKDFDTDAKAIQARSYKLLGDAYAEQGKNSDALSAYKKAAHHFEADETNSSEYLFIAAYFAQRVSNDSKEAIDLYKELKNKYPRTQKGFEADKYLAQLGVYSDEKK